MPVNFYDQVLAALSAETPMSFDDLARQVDLKRSRARLEFALDDLMRRGLVKPITEGDNTPRRAWLWRLDTSAPLPVVRPPSPPPPQPEPEPKAPRRGGRTPMGHPDYVYQPASEETKAKMRAAARKRHDTPEGFCRMYGELVPLIMQDLVRRVVAKAVYQATKRERERAAKKSENWGRVP